MELGGVGILGVGRYCLYLYLGDFCMLNVFETRTIAMMALVCSVAGTAASASATPLDGNTQSNPDGDLIVEQGEWVSSIHFDVRSQLGLVPGPADGWAGGSRGASDANFVLTGSLPEGDSVSAVAYTPDGTKFVIAHRESRNLIAYDAASDTVRVAHGELGLSIGGEAGYTESQSGTLSVIDSATFSRTDYDLGVGPSALAMSSDGNVLAVAAPIGDGVAILSFMPGCSSADLSEPFGVLNFFDVSVFLQAFANQDSAADFTGEGIFDFFDVSAFLQGFAAGCP